MTKSKDKSLDDYIDPCKKHRNLVDGVKFGTYKVLEPKVWCLDFQSPKVGKNSTIDGEPPDTAANEESTAAADVVDAHVDQSHGRLELSADQSLVGRARSSASNHPPCASVLLPTKECSRANSSAERPVGRHTDSANNTHLNSGNMVKMGPFVNQSLML